MSKLKEKLLSISKTETGKPFISLYVVVDGGDGGDGDLLDSYFDKQKAENSAKELVDTYLYMHVKETTISIDELLSILE